MSYNLIWVHVVFSTRKREHLLIKPIRYSLFKEIRKYALKIGVRSIVVNGVEDHIHLLIRLKTYDQLSEIIRKIKGYSSRWLNHNFPDLEEGFKWQKGYYADGVSNKDYMKMRNYVLSQEERHVHELYFEDWESPATWLQS